MPLRSGGPGEPCPVILRELYAGNTRFEALRAELGVVHLATVV
jgi:DNA-binding HxlR family transcriptional regulator